MKHQHLLYANNFELNKPMRGREEKKEKKKETKGDDWNFETNVNIKPNYVSISCSMLVYVRMPIPEI